MRWAGDEDAGGSGWEKRDGGRLRVRVAASYMFSEARHAAIEGSKQGHVSA